MNPEECRAFLSEGSRTGKLATVRPDGRPHVAPIWFVVDGDELVLMTHEGTVKARSLRHEPRVMLSVDDEVFPFGFVLVEGTATLERPTAQELEPWSRRIAERYVPAEIVDSTTARNAVEGELLVRVRVSKLTGMTEVAA
jgi:PPOX class probable F420-dependent enzyme